MTPIKRCPDHDSPQRAYLLALNRTIAALILGGVLTLAAGLWLPKALSAKELPVTNTSSTQPAN